MRRPLRFLPRYWRFWPKFVWYEARYRAECVGYWVRPYDMLLDARRWRWQERGRCSYMRPEIVLSAADFAALTKLAGTRKQDDSMVIDFPAVNTHIESDGGDGPIVWTK